MYTFYFLDFINADMTSVIFADLDIAHSVYMQFLKMDDLLILLLGFLYAYVLSMFGIFQYLFNIQIPMCEYS